MRVVAANTYKLEYYCERLFESCSVLLEWENGSGPRTITGARLLDRVDHAKREYCVQNAANHIHR
jgi:hypothetical protein